MLTISEILRAQNVNRWNLIAVSREQSVAEHTFNVTMIARRLCSLAGEPDARIIKAALEHDLDEVNTGDIPSPTKRMMANHGFDARVLEGQKLNCIALTEREAEILKIADLIDAVHYLYNFGVGVRAKDIQRGLVATLEQACREHKRTWQVDYRPTVQAILEEA